MPVARGDIREIVDSPVFVPLYNLYLVYGKIFKLSFGPKNFVIISDPDYARQILTTNSAKYSKGLLSEILDFVMGKGLIPADGEIWKIRRRTIVPAIHKCVMALLRAVEWDQRKYLVSMVDMFGDCTLHGCDNLDVLDASRREDAVLLHALVQAAREGKSVNMENFFSRLTLDIIGKAVFNYDFDSLTHDDPVIEAVYTVLAEAEHRSTAPLAYWELPGATQIIPRQRRCVQALQHALELHVVVVSRVSAAFIALNSHRFAVMAAISKRYRSLSSQDPGTMLCFIFCIHAQTLNNTLDDLIARSKKLGCHSTDSEFVQLWWFCKRAHGASHWRTLTCKEYLHQLLEKKVQDSLRLTTQVEEEDEEFVEEFLSEADPSILHFLIAAGEQITSKQLRDDLMTMLVAGHETTAALLTWTLYQLAGNPQIAGRVRQELESYFEGYMTLNHGESCGFGPLNGVIPNEVTSNFAYLPFGGGKRKCIGDQFALLESIAALAMLCRRYEFRLAPDAPPVRMTTGATIHTTQGLYMSVTPREVPPSLGRPPATFSGPTETKKAGTMQTPVPALASNGDMPGNNGNGSTVGAGLTAGAARP
ncbi:cytochrome P450 [Dunaliella salina]|uniref:Cytochrome P450 n=1 Tax=Dunaliella salina TaxID=3046 RepID=A0ABQ7G3I1_DUNSA|nr:cytochrome P450 [Dunaliella salina]|eukprot:KAF5829169.1 cytochrome P450 [Dunaliella salina]